MVIFVLQLQLFLAFQMFGSQGSYDLLFCCGEARVVGVGLHFLLLTEWISQTLNESYTSDSLFFFLVMLMRFTVLENEARYRMECSSASFSTWPRKWTLVLKIFLLAQTVASLLRLPARGATNASCGGLCVVNTCPVETGLRSPVHFTWVKKHQVITLGKW